MANVWMHNGFLQVEGEKMSKSLGNFVTIRELLDTDKFGGHEWPGEVLRLAMLRTHYRDPIDWTVKELERADRELREWYQQLEGIAFSGETIDKGVLEAISDDLNTHAAIFRIQELAKAGASSALRDSLGFLGFSCDPTKLTYRVFVNLEGATTVTAAGNITFELRANDAQDRAVFYIENDGPRTDESTQRRIDDLIAQRQEARAVRNWAEADHLRDQLAALRVAIKDNKDGTTSWEIKR
jgi:cysteinyl-tRNA synthetase